MNKVRLIMTGLFIALSTFAFCNDAKDVPELTKLIYANINSQPNLSLKYIQEVLEEESADNVYKTYALLYKGFIHNHYGDFGIALESFHQAQQFDAEGALYANLLHNIGWTHRLTGNTDLALYSLMKANAADSNHLITYSELAMTYLLMKEYDRSAKMLDTYYVKSLENNSNRDILNALNNTGYLYIQKGDYAKAKTYLDQAIAIKDTITSISSSFEEANIYNNLGIVAARQGKTQQAIRYLENGLDIARRISAKKIQLEAVTELRKLYLAAGDIEKVDHYADQELALSKKLADAKDNYQGILLEQEKIQLANSTQKVSKYKTLFIYLSTSVGIILTLFLLILLKFRLDRNKNRKALNGVKASMNKALFLIEESGGRLNEKDFKKLKKFTFESEK